MSSVDNHSTRALRPAVTQLQLQQRVQYSAAALLLVSLGLTTLFNRKTFDLLRLNKNRSLVSFMLSSFIARTPKFLV